MGKDLIIYVSQMFPLPTIAKILNDIQLYKPKKLLFFNPNECTFLGTENRNEFDELNILLEKYDIKFYVLIGSESINGNRDILIGKNIEYIFWPTSLIHLTYGAIKRDLNDFIPKNVKTLYSYHNMKPRKHRGCFLEKLFVNDLFEYGDITWNILTNEDNSGEHHEFKIWKEKKLTHNIEDNRDSYKIEIFNDDSLIHIIGETETEKNFITEKTYRTIFIEKPFIVFGSKNANTGLKKYGFQIFDEFIDYGFDEEENIEDRLDGIIENLNKIKNQNVVDLYNSIFHKLKHNKNRILEIVNKDEHIPSKLIELYKEYNSEFDEFFGQNFVDTYIKKIIKNSYE